MIRQSISAIIGGSDAVTVVREDSGLTFQGLLDRPAGKDLGISGNVPTLCTTPAILRDLNPGEALWIEGERYAIAHQVVERDTGRAKLRLLGWEVQTFLSDAFQATWLDESEQPQDPAYLTLRWNPAGSRGHLLFWIDVAALLPRYATRCGYALLGANLAAGADPVQWTAHAVRRSVDMANVTWNQYRFNAAWGAPGGLAVGSDYTALAIGSGVTESPGWTALADPAALGAAVSAKVGRTMAMIVLPAAPPGEARFYTGGDRAHHPAPRLTLRRAAS